MRPTHALWTALTLLACGSSSYAQAAPAAPVRPPAAVAVPSPPVARPMTVDPAREKTIRQLLEVTGTMKLSQQMMDQMFISMQTSMPGLPAEFWTRTRARFKSDDLIALIIPIYDKYYTQEELDGLLAFYQSPLGRKVIATLPQVQRESMTVGQAWGQKQAEEVLAQIEQERKSSRKHAQTKATTM